MAHIIDDQSYHPFASPIGDDNQYVEVSRPDNPSWFGDNAVEGDWNSLYVNQTSNRQNVIESWWNSEQTADRDFVRQMFGQQYQNWYESASEQMNRAAAAGINLNTAAAGIVGTASAGASPMSSPQTDSNNPLSELANVANGITGGLKNLSDATKAVTEAHEINQLLPLKGLGLQVDTLLSLENIGLTRAQAQSVSIANQYDPIRFQLGIAKARLELPILIQQEKVFRAEYEKDMTEIDKMESDMRVNDASISLMDKQGFNQMCQARRSAAEANLISKRFELLQKMNWDPATGLDGLVGTYLVNPDFKHDDLVQLMNNLTSYSYDMAKYKFLGDNNLPLNSGKSLFELQSESDINTSYGSRKDIPVDVSIGPFKTSTNLRDFGHQYNKNKSVHNLQREIRSTQYYK